jgi:hypothetical protein
MFVSTHRLIRIYSVFEFREDIRLKTLTSHYIHCEESKFSLSNLPFSYLENTTMVQEMLLDCCFKLLIRGPGVANRRRKQGQKKLVILSF